MPRIGRPGRTLIVLALLTAGLFALMGFSNNWVPRLGLDLRGGTTITLTAANTTGGGQIDPVSLNLARTIIQSRVDSLGVGETEVAVSGDRQIIVSVPGQEQDELVRLVGQTAQLRFRAVYQAEPVTPPAPPPPPPSSSASPEPGTSASPSAPASAPASPPPSAGAPSASESGDRRPLPQLPTAPPTPQAPRPSEPGQGTPPQEAAAYEPTERDLEDFATLSCEQAAQLPDVSDQPLIACDQEGTEKYLLGPTLVEGDQLTNAVAGVRQNEVSWVVNLDFNAEGAALFESATEALSQKQDPQNRFAIVLDGQSISAPSVDNPIPGGRAEISGGFTQASATELANILKYGALPLSFEVSEVANVSATLGGDQLRAGLIAGAIGLALVVAFSLFYYRGLALVVVSSLAVAGALTYAVMVLLGSSVGFALNLSGIAGAVVAIGITADSFVIYFERIRDEVRDGRSLRTAIETGWRRARATVLIADAVSMLSAVILFILAIGAVKGFAFTLGLTTVIDVLVVFMFTKPLLSLLSRTKFFGGGHPLSGLDPRHLGVAALPGTRPRRTPTERTPPRLGPTAVEET